MALSNELISEFVKATKDTNNKSKDGTTVYGTTVKGEDGTMFVQIDGSTLLTPVIATANTVDGERVTVVIKDHAATITGNISSPAARSGDVSDAVDQITALEGDVSDAVDQITELEIVVSKKVSTEEFDAEVGRIDSLVSDNILVKDKLIAAEGDIDNLQASVLTVDEKITAAEGNIIKLQTDKLDAELAEITYATIKDLDATNLDVHNLESTYAEFSSATADQLEAIEASITKLEAGDISTETLQTLFANIDFSNIGKAAMEYFYANSGLIDNVIVGDGTITGNLVGVTITGDLIEADTLVADKIVMLGEDGIYYKLNTNGEAIGADQTDYNSLNGQIITAKSITAEKVNINDLVAFDATIGGFNITETAIFSEVKDSDDNTTRGIYMNSDGQINFGDSNNYIKYLRDDDGEYHLVISADTIMYDVNGKQHALSDLGVIGEYVKIATYEDEPAIELGESDSDFKMVITNTRILFMEGTGVPAYVSNQSLYIKKAIIETELQQGGFVWTVRKNGNLGLIWKGVIS